MIRIRTRRLGCIAMVALVGVAVATVPVGATEHATGHERSKKAAPRGYQKAIKVAIADIQDYWSDEFSKLYDSAYVPIPRNRVYAARPDSTKLPTCAGEQLTYDQVHNNAQYVACGDGQNFIWYDDAELLPQLVHDFGTFSVGLVLAHEWGHAIQDRSGNLDQERVLKEQQADCFAGAWTQRVENGDSRVEITGGELDSALAALLFLRDNPGGSTDPSEDPHGNGFDRVRAFQDGFGGGGAACKDYFDNPPPITEVPFSDAEEAASGGNLPEAQIVPVSIELLNDFYRQAEEGYQPLTADDVVAYDASGPKRQLPTCGGSSASVKALTNAVFYCDDGYIAYDERYIGTVYDSIGDFGVTVLLATAWSKYIESEQQFPGVDDDTDNAILGADCYAGGFTAAVHNGALSSATLDGTVQLSPGDLDETIQAFLDYSKVRGIDHAADATFLEVRAFRDGFLDGYQSCSSYAGDSSAGGR